MILVFRCFYVLKISKNQNRMDRPRNKKNGRSVDDKDHRMDVKGLEEAIRKTTKKMKLWNGRNIEKMSKVQLLATSTTDKDTARSGTTQDRRHWMSIVRDRATWKLICNV